MSWFEQLIAACASGLVAAAGLYLGIRVDMVQAVIKADHAEKKAQEAKDSAQSAHDRITEHLIGQHIKMGSNQN